MLSDKFTDMKLTPILLLLLLCLCFLSCGSRTDYPNLLTKADSLMDARPDSALRLLQSIPPSALEEGGRMRHRLLAVEAECRNGIFTVNDSVVSTLVDYFRQKDDVAMLAKVYYCQALLYSGRQQYDMALITYRKAIPHARKAQDWRLLGRIYGNMGYLLQNNGLDVQADSLYLQAGQMALRSGDTLLWAETLHRQAIYQLGQGKKAYPKAEQLLQQSYNMLDDDRRSSVSLSLSYLYSRMKRSDLALHYAKEAVRLSQRDSSQLFRAYVVLGDVFYQTAQYDSACYYFLQSMRSEASEVKMNACMRLADIARKQEDWKQVAYYQDQESKYREMYSKQEQREEIILAEKEQVIEQWKIWVQKHQKKVYGIGTLFFLLIVWLLLHLLLRKRKYEKLRREMEHILSAHGSILPQTVKRNVLGIEAGKCYTEESFLRFRTEIRHTDIYQKMDRIILYQRAHAGKKGGESFDVDDKVALVGEVDKLLPGYIHWLRSRFPLLDERDVLVLCLYLIGFSVPQIGLILDRHRDSIYKHIRKIKKEKMKFLDEKDIIEILHHVE